MRKLFLAGVFCFHQVFTPMQPKADRCHVPADKYNRLFGHGHGLRHAVERCNTDHRIQYQPYWRYYESNTKIEYIGTIDCEGATVQIVDGSTTYSRDNPSTD